MSFRLQFKLLQQCISGPVIRNKAGFPVECEKIG
jgi:hypothetical protein